MVFPYTAVSKMIRLKSHSLNKLRIWPQILFLLSSVNLENYQLEFLKNEKSLSKSLRAEEGLLKGLKNNFKPSVGWAAENSGSLHFYF